ncbi:MAG: type II toxin-antitoxin system VapC family toxin [Anaerolineae bacterium]
MKRRMLDTDTLSYMLKGREPVASRAKAYIVEHGGISISAITFYEVLRGLRFVDATRQLQAFEDFARTNEIFPLDVRVCRRAADIYADLRRAGNLIEDADLLIAATALANDCVLVTNNTDHYGRIANLELENWAA